MSMDSELSVRILKKSIPLFIEKGYEQVRVDEICEACHITKPTFYRFAGSKGELIQAYYNQILKELLEDWDVFRMPNPWTQVISRLSLLLSLVMQDGVDLCKNLLMQDLAGGAAKTILASDDLYQRILGEVKLALDQDILDCQVPAETVAKTMIVAMVGAIAQWVITKGRQDAISDFVDAMILYCRPRRWTGD